MRCSWVNVNNINYVNYHDNEWGIPKHDDQELYEIFLLECFQAGLSWECVLNKRENFRNAYDQFDYHKIATYDDKKIDELLNNSGLIRNRNKIIASINNAKVFLDIQNEYGSFDKYIWKFTNFKSLKNVFRTTNHISDIISKDLYKRGMRFVGSITIYSYLQAIGIIIDHDKNCFKYLD